MRPLFFRLAATNLKQNRRIYLPYVLAAIGTVAMFYLMTFLAMGEGLYGVGGAQTLRAILSLGTIVIALFSLVLIFYTNSFLIKRRKKEFGLYNLLGMEKRHIARVIAIETLYVGLFSIVTGLLCGILFSKLLLLVLCRVLAFPVPFGFEIPPLALLVTAILFVCVFLLILFYNLRQIRVQNPVGLLSGGKVGEKEPKAKWLLAVLGTICLSGGYAIALAVQQPIQALSLFFIAVVLVIAGTYFLFTAGSIALLKGLRRKKSYYYKARHFISISGMIYRMKQNAAGLATVCILSTMVLVMVSTTFSLYIGIEDEMRLAFPRDVAVHAYGATEDDARAAVTQEEADFIQGEVDAVLAQHGIEPERARSYRYLGCVVNGRDGIYSLGNDEMDENATALVLLTLPDYNKLMGETVSLAPNEVLLYTGNYDYEGDTITLAQQTYSVRRLETLEVSPAYSNHLFATYYLVFPDEETVLDMGKTFVSQGICYYYGFDVEGTDAEKIALHEDISQRMHEDEEQSSFVTITESAARSYASFLEVYGGLFFLGSFLGILFCAATVLIIYYKQVSEGYDDKERFEILQKVGMSREEVKKTIRSQIVTVFFLPLACAVLHIAMAFPMITRMLRVLNLTNVSLFALCCLATTLVFALLYLLVYSLTARAYYRIVERT